MKTLIHKESAVEKTIPEGFSWTMLFFGGFVPALRGDIKGAVISFGLALITGGISWLVLPFFYNRKYQEQLTVEGWVSVEKFAQIQEDRMIDKAIKAKMVESLTK